MDPFYSVKIPDPNDSKRSATTYLPTLTGRNGQREVSRRLPWLDCFALLKVFHFGIGDKADSSRKAGGFLLPTYPS